MNIDKILKFNISEENDINIFQMLLSDNNPSDQRKNLILKKYPILIKNKNTTNFVKVKYQNNFNKIKKNTDKINIEWNKIESIFFNLSKKIFRDLNIENLKINAFPSIWPLYIKDIKNHSISFPYNDGINDALFVISHEILHILFFNLLEKSYSKCIKNLNDLKVYQFSENLNVLIQNQNEWIDVFKIKSKPYLGHEKLFKKMNNYWKTEKNINFLIKKALLN